LRVLREAIVLYHAPDGEEKPTKRDVEAFFEREAIAHELTSDDAEILRATLTKLMKMVDDDNNSIWIFVLNNLYAPLMMHENPFDLIISNPPWIVNRSIQNRDYQKFLKSQVFAYQLLDSKETHLYQAMEMATLFFRKTSDIYLKDKGEIAFVMPISVTTGALHHTRFNRFEMPDMKLERVSSFRRVPGIFSLPPCVLIAVKGSQGTFPVPMTEWDGSLAGRRRNSSLNEILPILHSTEKDYVPAQAPKGDSAYSSLFGEG